MFDTWRMTADICLQDNRGWLHPGMGAHDACDGIMAMMGRGISKYTTTRFEYDSQALGLRIQYMQQGRWAMSGYPTVTPTHRAAASWMATNYGDAKALDIIPPWPAWVVRLPTDMLFVTDNYGKAHPLTLLSVANLPDEDTNPVREGRGGWYYTLATDMILTENGPDALTLWRFGLAQGDLCKDELPSGGHNWATVKESGTDARAHTFAMRLILGMCLHFADSKNKGEGKVRRTKPSKRQREADVLPDYKVWDMRSDISIDVVRAVKHFARTGNGSSPTVQGMVCGHGKWQAYGAKRALRRWIHVKPYWRGPEDAPVIRRS